MYESFEVSHGEWEDQCRIRMFIELYEGIGIKVITMRMGDIECIDTREFLSIEPHFHRAFHEVSESIIREPSIDEDADISTFGIGDIDEEFGMSEWGDNHMVFLLGKSKNAI